MVGHFRLEEVENLLPEVAFLVKELRHVHKELQQEYKRAVELQQVMGSGGLQYLQENKHYIQALNEEYEELVDSIESLGAIVKDTGTGLVDFPGKFRGKDIYFCWKLGEDNVNHWHPRDAGSMERKKILR